MDITHSLVHIGIIVPTTFSSPIIYQQMSYHRHTRLVYICLCWLHFVRQSEMLWFLFWKMNFFPLASELAAKVSYSSAKSFTAPPNQMKHYIKPYLFLESIRTVGVKLLIQLSQVFRFYFRVMISISLAGFSAFFKHICETDIRLFEIWFIKNINVSCV